MKMGIGPVSGHCNISFQVRNLGVPTTKSNTSSFVDMILLLQIRKMDNWFLTRLDMMGYAYPRRISTYAILADHETISQELASQEYYFMAPKEYIDNKVCSNIHVT